VDQLKHSKTPYRLVDGGTTIKVPADRVYETRLALMASGAPLAGGVGFEIFDKQGLGTSEQVQRVTFQRALQGELARTIAALDNVERARVHLVLPESSLFRRDREEARAAVSLTLKSGARLSREEITGVQRLVAASVAGLDAARVVVTDQRGITLAGAETGETGLGAGESRLDMKSDIEEYISRKVARLLDRTYGPGRAIVSVDVALNFDEIKRTVQDLLPVRAGNTADGGVLRKRQVLSAPQAASYGWSVDAGVTAPQGMQSASTEIEYEYGHRVEQVIAAPGGIARISVGVVVPDELAVDKQERIAELVRAAAGINDARGDAVIVQSVGALRDSSVAAATEAPALPAAALSTPSGPAAQSAIAAPMTVASLGRWSYWLLAVVAAALMFVLIRVAQKRSLVQMQVTLSPQQRESLLAEVEAALAGEGRKS
jgi:flagellar M-ring protein FliF